MKNLQSELLRQGLSTSTLAKKTGVSQRNLQRYIRGDVEPSLKTAMRIANALCVSLDYLCGVTESRCGKPVNTN